MGNGDDEARIRATVTRLLEEQLEARRTADRERLAAARRARGRWDGQGSGPLPLGYKRVWDGLEGSGRWGRIVVDELQAPIVRRIFALHAEGLSVRDIAALLEHEGVRTSKGGLFTPSSIQQVLAHRELYETGRRMYAGVEAAVRWPTIL